MKVRREQVILRGMKCCTSACYAHEYPINKNSSLTKYDVFQLFTELPVLPDRHCLLGGVLCQTELDVSREIILPWTSLPGRVFNMTTPARRGKVRERQLRGGPRTLNLQNLVSLPAPMLTIWHFLPATDDSSNPSFTIRSPDVGPDVDQRRARGLEMGSLDQESDKWVAQIPQLHSRQTSDCCIRIQGAPPRARLLLSTFR